uniref:Uncharacterized protein n=1 Tax=Oryza brachyantha TaxID=4533 RepID=J3MFT1_ORYBR
MEGDLGVDEEDRRPSGFFMLALSVGAGPYGSGRGVIIFINTPHQGFPYRASRQNRGTALPRIPHGNRKNQDKFEPKKFEFKLARFSWLTAW